MGTRGFVGFVADGKETITYCQYDSYPSGVGLNVLHWARTVTDWNEVRRQAAALVHVDDDTPPTPEQIERLRQYADTDVSTRKLTEWYVLLRETQGEPALILESGHAEHASEWPGDSLFCEWGYLIDLDQSVLEVYRGFQTKPHTTGRFHDRTRDGGPEPSYGGGSTYYPVRLVRTWKFSELPDEPVFLRLES